MSEFKQVLNKRTGQFNLVPTNVVIDFKTGVATYTALPVTGNTKGDGRITNDTGHLYIWSLVATSGALTDWIDEGDVIDLNWSAISGRPNSSVADIDDAVNKKHDKYMLQPVVDGFKSIIFKRASDLENDPIWANSDMYNEFLRIDTTYQTKIKLHLPRYPIGQVLVTNQYVQYIPHDFTGTKGGAQATTVTITTGATWILRQLEGKIILWADGDTDTIKTVTDGTHFETYAQSYKSEQAFEIKDPVFCIAEQGYGLNHPTGINTAYPWADLHVNSRGTNPGFLVGDINAEGAAGTMCIAGSCGNLGWLQLPCHYDAGSGEWEDGNRGALIISLNSKHGAPFGGWDLTNSNINYPFNNAAFGCALTLSYHFNDYYGAGGAYEMRGMTYYGSVNRDKSLRNVFQVTSFGKVGISHPKPLCRLHIEDWDGWRGSTSFDLFDYTHKNDFEIGGIWTLPTAADYIFKISSVAISGNPDKFQWSNDFGATWSAEINIPAAAAFMALANGIKIRWLSDTGHTINDTWTYHIYENYGQLTMDEAVVTLGIPTTALVRLGKTLNDGIAHQGVAFYYDSGLGHLESIDLVSAGWVGMVYDASHHDFRCTGDTYPTLLIDNATVTIGTPGDNIPLKVIGELSIKVYEQTTEPILGADQRMAMWVDTDDNYKVYLVYRRTHISGLNDQVKVQLA